jgi:hypothetical protein
MLRITGDGSILLSLTVIARGSRLIDGMAPSSSSICALESLGTEADASTLRSALNGEVVWVIIHHPLMQSHSDIR